MSHPSFPESRSRSPEKPATPAEPAELRAALARILAARLGCDGIEALERLSGGASQETWSFDARRDGERLELVLRRAPGAGRGETSLALAQEARLQRIVRAHGVPVPRIVLELEPDDGLGDGYVMERIAGETIARRILRDERLAAARRGLARQCGRVLARIHRVPAEEVEWLHESSGPEQLARYDALYRALEEPRPLFDLAFVALEGKLDAREETLLVHGDFRNGNLIVGEEGLRAALDWELAHRGDPYEDLAWICVNSWRFGQVDHPVGGFGSREDLLLGYREEGGHEVDAERLRSWELFGTLKWGVMCLLQAFSHLEGRTRSVEKAAIGRRVSETEVDLSRLLASGSIVRSTCTDRHPPASSPPWARGERPSILDLVAAVRELLERDVRRLPEPSASFEHRVAANALGIVERELREGPEIDREEAARLRALVGDRPGDVRELNRELCRRIRSREIGAATPDLLWHLARTAEDKLRVDNPRYRPLPWS